MQNLSSHWEVEVDKILPLLGHRNWILVVDKAFPLQSSNGMLYYDTKCSIATVLDKLINMLEQSKHIKPIVYTDLEFNYLDDYLIPGVSEEKDVILSILNKFSINTLLHEEIFEKMNISSKLFTTLVLKTESIIPYSSVFFELDCAYWSSEKEKKLRRFMNEKEINTI